MDCNSLWSIRIRVIRVSSMVRIRVKVGVSIMVRVSIRTRWVVNLPTHQTDF